jgi:LysM repeat protein
MQKLSLYRVGLAAGLCLFAASAALGADNFSLTLDAKYTVHSDLNVAPAYDFAKDGFGGSVMFEWYPVDFWSVGAEFDGDTYLGKLGVHSRYASAIDLLTRLSPFPGQIVSPYVLLGGGLSPILQYKNDYWPGNYHLFAQAGVQVFLNPKLALDLGGRYSYYPAASSSAPVNFQGFTDSLQSFSAVFGFSYFFDNAAKGHTLFTVSSLNVQSKTEGAQKNTIVAPVKVVQEPPKEAAAEGDIYTVAPGDTLWSISGQKNVYSNDFQWPLIYSTNKDQIKDPDSIAVGQKLKIRHDFSAMDIENAIEEAANAPDSPGKNK